MAGHEGVAILARSPAAIKPLQLGTETAELLADTSRWVEAYVPVRQPANVRGVYVASVYGRPGESSEDIFEGALA
eukprot:736817-Alexandrium_andersonii.AAC.1